MPIPAWYEALLDEPNRSEPYYEVVYRCSQKHLINDLASGEDKMDIVETFKVGYLPKQSWDFNGRNFAVKNLASCSCCQITVIRLDYAQLFRGNE